MNSRDDNLKMISNLVTPETLSKILFKNYSDSIIEHICGYAPTIEIFANTRYKPETVEKLMGLMKDKKIDSFDLMELMRDSLRNNRNEQYIDAFSEAVTFENRYDAYSVLRTTNITDVSFDEMYLGIHQSVYEANNDRIVQINSELAGEMRDLGITLSASEDISYFVPQKHRLASAINDMRRQPDWSDFKEYLKNKISDMDKLTPYILEQKYTDFQVNRGLSKLADKVAGDYERYIADLRTKTPDDIIRAAYEIYNKKYIVDYCNMSMTSLSPDDIQVLLDTDNVLDEIYQEWDVMTQFNGVAEIDTAIEETAYRLRSAQAIKQVMEQRRAAELPEVNPEKRQPAVPKPTKHSRR